MNSYILIIVLVVGVAVGFWFTQKNKKGDGFIGKNSIEKEGNKTRILAEFASKTRLTNNDIEKLLGVSDATATRYLEDLEKDGFIKQVGTEGRFVYYTLAE